MSISFFGYVVKFGRTFKAGVKPLVMASVLVAGLSACVQQQAAVPGFVEGSCRFINGEQAPDWRCAPTAVFPSDRVFSQGQALAGSGNDEVMLQLAMHQAKVRMGQIMQAKVADHFGKSMPFNVSLPPIKLVERISDANGNLYVLISTELDSFEQRQAMHIKQLSQPKS